ncbi:cytochrome c [Myroides sp. JBRI-B21084]|uniref:c-type cytochrome n=1 Tax=Myroides sp. JBRI-B21084 TaxID=3119977 RepID=UPI0026E3C423|nr:cytochrome c [Paenimyroides cloacae]WKW47166.1 cytochrome c [Paenimyroides cloacae]
MNHKKYVGILLVLLTLFFIYNFHIYTDKENYADVVLTQKALRGQHLWYKNNCNSCHQIYGLGGYLGPDLTNIYSFRNQNDAYLKILFNSGIKTMPLFDFNEQEKEELVQFLKEIDQTGHSPNIHSKIEINGWIDINHKKQHHE